MYNHSRGFVVYEYPNYELTAHNPNFANPDSESIHNFNFGFDKHLDEFEIYIGGWSYPQDLVICPYQNHEKQSL